MSNPPHLTPVAHTRNALGLRHDLAAHLRGVAGLAREFAADLGAPDLGYYLGLWHDLGKFHPRFQEYLLACEREPGVRRSGPDHKGAGAALAKRHVSIAAFLVQGHHGGLQSRPALRAWLEERERAQDVKEALALARAAIPDLEPPGPLPFPPFAVNDPGAAELLLRLLFSALVDADFLDTEAHFSPDRAAARGESVTLSELWKRFEQDQERLATAVREAGRANDAVIRARDDIYRACLAAAERPPGLFRLTAPTGSGKTRAAMAFALRHALQHGHRRVIVAVPFLSITEQTAEVYRRVFEDPGGRPVVLEHHSGASVGGEDDEDFRERGVWSRLAAENWDAPIVVTTTVQLFESLFAARPARCRKLHRLARSVIILDEAQALPSHLLTPILDVLRQLVAHYGVTAVLSTATQPAFEAIPPFRELKATEIVPEPARYFRDLARVEFDWRLDRPLPWPEVAEVIRAEQQVLAVVNTKRDALALLGALQDPDALHLSTLLCGAHRRRVIAEVTRRLQEGLPCRLVSTQVIEAGVDLDFPVVVRAFGPLDSVIQAAGRANREGRRAQGRVVVFEPAEGGLPGGAYRTGTDVARVVLQRRQGDLHDPATPYQYFEELYKALGSATDREGIQQLRQAFDYPETARRFRMIDDDTDVVVVTSYGTAEERQRVRTLVERLRSGAPDARELLRRLQPYVVSVRRREAARYRQQGLIDEVMPGVGEWLGGYDDVTGLAAPDPEQLVV